MSSSQKKHLSNFSIIFSPRWTSRSDVMSSNSSRYPGDGLIHRSGNTDYSLWTWWWELTRHPSKTIWNLAFWKYFTSFKMAFRNCYLFLVQFVNQTYYKNSCILERWKRYIWACVCVCLGPFPLFNENIFQLLFF